MLEYLVVALFALRSVEAAPPSFPNQQSQGQQFLLLSKQESGRVEEALKSVKGGQLINY